MSEISSHLLQRLVDAGLNSEQSLAVARLIEMNPRGLSYVEVILDSLIEHGRHDEIPEFLATFATRMVEENIGAKGSRARASQRQSDYIAPCGPRERWGYEGVVTPRLADRDWWPLRWSILVRDNHTCHYCGDQPEQMCADHVVPLSRGGTNHSDNLVACCIPCNSSKADRLLSEWKGRYR